MSAPAVISIDRATSRKGNSFSNPRTSRKKEQVNPQLVEAIGLQTLARMANFSKPLRLQSRKQFASWIASKIIDDGRVKRYDQRITIAHAVIKWLLRGGQNVAKVRIIDCGKLKSKQDRSISIQLTDAGVKALAEVRDGKKRTSTRRIARQALMGIEAVA